MNCEQLTNELAEVMDEFMGLSNLLRYIKSELRRLWWLLVVTVDPVKREKIIAQREALTLRAASVGAELQECWDKRQEIKKQIAELGCE